MILWVFGQIDLDQVTRAIEQFTTLVAEVREMQSFPLGGVAFSQGVDRLQA